MRAPLPEGYTLRPVRTDDLESVIAMFNADAKQVIGVEKFTSDMFLPEWTTPKFDLERDTRLVIAPDGSIAGYYEVWDLEDPHVQIFSWGRVHPAHTGKCVGTSLLGWAEERARLAIPKAPAEARVKLLVDTLDINPLAHELFRNCGFKLVRHSLRMVTSLNDSLPQPEWPADIAVRSMRLGQDERAVFAAFREAFQDHWGHVEWPFEEEYARWLHHNKSRQDFDPSLWFLALDGDQIAGICLCRMTTHDDPEMGWVSILAVRKPWRQRGLGLALLYNAFGEFQRRGKSKVGLGVDAENLTGATRLYLRAGMQPDPNRQFSIYEKELRPGVELATQAL